MTTPITPTQANRLALAAGHGDTLIATSCEDANRLRMSLANAGKLHVVVVVRRVDAIQSKDLNHG